MGLLSVFSATVTLSVALCDPARQQSGDLPAALASARSVPADVEMFVHIGDAGSIRREMSSRPIARVVETLSKDSAVVKAWSRLARDLHTSEAELFDTCFGRGFTFASRSSGQWVLVTDLGEQRSRDLLRRLDVRVRQPRFGLAVSELPEQDLLLASDGQQVVIGPSAQPQLFFDVLQRVNADDGAAKAAKSPATLADDVDLKQRVADMPLDARGYSAGAFIRHQRLLGGCSLVLADLQGDHVQLHHAARFANPLFSAPITKLECDFSPLNLFAGQALLAVMQPRDAGDGPVESFLSASLGLGLLSPEMRRNLADRRLLVVGEQDARQLPEPSDILTTTFVACLELKDASAGVEQLDRQMKRLTLRLNDLGKGAFLIETPDTAGLPPCQARHAGLGGAEEWFTGGFPVMKTVSLNWTVARGPDNDGPAWFVVGSNPQALDETVHTLRQTCPRDEGLVGKFDSCGLANGMRLGRHIESWSEDTAQFTDPPHVDEVRNTLRTLAELANGLQVCRWQMERPTATTMKLDVQITLTPEQSAERQP